MKEKHILTDCDGCLLVWNEAFEKFMEKKGYPIQFPHEYKIGLRHGISPELEFEYLREFNHSEAIRSLKPLGDSVEYIAKLHSEGFRFTVITSLSNNPQSKKFREENLRNVFGDVFEEIICLPIHSEKESTLARWKDSGLFWIEDHVNHAESGYREGLRSILIRHPYNQEFDTEKFYIVGNNQPWKQIYTIITNNYAI